MRKILLTIITVSSLFGFSSAQAAISPVGIEIVPPVQFPPEDFSVTGVRVSALWGKNRGVYGLDVGGLGNITELDFVGIGVSGLVNMTHGTTTILGLQAAGAANINTQRTRVWGVQAAAVNSNTAESYVAGLEVGALANLCDHTNIYGVQVGLYNKAYAVYGFQIGLLNFATEVHGLQIGLMNFNEKGVFKVSPVLNFGF